MQKQLWQQLRATVTLNHVALGAKLATIIGATVALFSQDLIIVFTDALLSDTTSHILAIPVLVAYLVYRKRKMIKATIQFDRANLPENRKYGVSIGILLLLTAILLYWHGSNTFTPLEYHLLALPPFVAAVILILFNLQTLRQLAFPIAFLFFLVPPPAEVLYTLGTTLAIISTEFSHTIIQLIGIPSVLTTNDYGNPAVLVTRAPGDSILFAVDIACSGIFSLIGFLIFAVFLTYIVRDKPWKRLAIFLLGIPLVYFVNIIRITTIILLGYHYGEEIVTQAFHLLGGWILIFFGVLLLLLVADKGLKTQFFPDPSMPCSECTERRTPRRFCMVCGRIIRPLERGFKKLDAVKIAAILLTVTALLSIQAPTFALTQELPLVIVETPSGQQVTTEILPQVPNYTLSFVTRDTDFEQLARQDMSLVYLYTPQNRSQAGIWVQLEVASSRSSLHGWELCLITWPLSHGSQPRALRIESKDVQLTDNPPIISRYFAFNLSQTNEPQAVLYWYETTTFRAENATSQKHVKISLIAYPGTMANFPTVESQLIAVAKAVVSYWQPIKIWSRITLLISQNGASLLMLTSSLIAGIMIFHRWEARKRVLRNQTAYRKFSQSNKQTIMAAAQTQANKNPTLENILTEHQQITGHPISAQQLLERLQQLDKTGLIESRITNSADEPLQTWHTHINGGSIQ
jgi:exosortase